MSDSQKGNGEHRSGNGDGTWISGVVPDDSVSNVAARSLETRLAAVRDYLPLAAEKSDEDADYVHQLRVATRRSTAAFKMYDAVLPKRDATMIQTDLKQVRRSAKDARDYDVFISRLCTDNTDSAAQRFVKNLRTRRRQAQEPIVAAYQELARDNCFERDVARMLDQVVEQEKKRIKRNDQLFGPWSRSSLRPIVNRFFKSEPIDWASLRALHQLRNRGKSLRYAMELLGATFPDEFQFELYPVIERLQNMLGRISDHAKTLSRFGDWFDEAQDASRRNYLAVLLADEHLQLEQSREAFVSWWKPRRDNIHTWFKDMIASPVERIGRTSGNWKGLEILVAEDSLVNQTLAIGLLCNLNHRVAVASNGKEAVNLSASRNFDLVLMDIEMPEMDGLEATRLIRRRERQTGRHVPIIAVTSETQDGTQEQCLSAGMDGFLPKPLRTEPLCDTMDNIFQGSVCSPSKSQTLSPRQLFRQ